MQELEEINKAADILGVKKCEIEFYVKTGALQEKSGKISVVAAAKLLINNRGSHKKEMRIYFPRTTVMLSTLLAIESVAAQRGVSIGRATEMLLYESISFLSAVGKE